MIRASVRLDWPPSRFAWLVVMMLPSPAIGLAQEVARVEVGIGEAVARHTRALAHDSMVGRFPGTLGGTAAAHYIAGALRAAGIRPAYQGTYEQPVPISGTTVDHERLRAVLRTDQAQTDLPTDFLVVRSTALGEEIAISGDLVFVGYGVHAPARGWDDYAGVDVRGRVAVVLPDLPDTADREWIPVADSYHGLDEAKIREAHSRGAVGVLFLVAEPDSQNITERMREDTYIEFQHADWVSPQLTSVIAWAGASTLRTMLEVLGTTYVELERLAVDLSFHAFSLGGTIEFVFRQRRRVFAAPNIVGVLPGRDPAAGAVLVTAHYDGLGIGAPDARGDTIYNGARDNASGVAGLLVLAEQLARGRRLRRTVIFIATTAEEADFDHVGARYYAEHPVIPLDETVFGLNLDGLAWRAPTRDFLLIPAQTTPAETTITRLAAALDMELSRTSWQNGLNFSFDAEVFLARGVPMVTLWGGSRYRVRDSSATAILTRSSGIHAPHDEFQADWNRPALAQHVELYLTALRHYAGDVSSPGLHAVHPFSDVPVSSGASEEASVELPSNGRLPWRSLARAIVARLAPAPGELVLFLCRPGRFDDLVPELWYALAERSAIGLGCLDVIGRPYPDDWESGTLSAAWQRTRDATRSWMENADAVIVLPGAWPTEPAYRALQDHLASGRGRAIHFHWDGGRMLDGRDRDVDEVADAMYVRAVLETDHRALATLQREFEQAARRGAIRVTTPDGTDLTFRVGDRPISRQDGDASRERTRTAQILIDREIEVPAGAVRVAPVEESVHGTIVFPDSYWNGHRVEAPRLEFQSGRVVSISARQGVEYLRAALEQGDGSALRFRAFALGFNPLLAVPDSAPWIPYYGYGAGVVRLSLGANAELGGAVQGNYARWNFFTNATVTVGTEVWVREGRLVRTAR